MSIIAILYSLVAVIALYGYIPQIIRLWNAEDNCPNIALQAWHTWNASHIITFLYAAIEVQDFLLSVSASVNILCISAIIALTVLKRSQFRKKPVPVFISAETTHN